MSKKKRRLQAVYLEWVDSAGPGNHWVFPEDCTMKPTTIHTRGFVVKETKKSVTVASSISTSGCVGGMMTIPKIAIKSRWTGK